MKLPDGVELDVNADGGLRCRLATKQAHGWLTPALAPCLAGPARAPALPHAAAEDAFASHFAAATADGFVAADAAVLAMMKTCHPDQLPRLSWGEQPAGAFTLAKPSRRLDLYAIVDSAERLQQVLAAGVKTVQLRVKTPDHADGQWFDMLRLEVERSVAACATAGAELFVNDHWQLAVQAGANGVHLGQEDLLALGEDGRAELRATGMALGISSHSLWELCRARMLAPRYIACGPVWPTLTKAMPWRPQGLDNLSWWCRLAGTPVVAIGGILGPEQMFEAASCGADGVCIVRGLGEQPDAVVPALQRALEAGRRATAQDLDAPAWPHPSLANA